MSKPRTAPIGKRNIVGTKIVQLRKARGMKQKDLVIRLQNMGMDISDTSMSRLEGQTRLVQDFEIPVLAKALNVSIEWLLEQEEEYSKETVIWRETEESLQEQVRTATEQLEKSKLEIVRLKAEIYDILSKNGDI